MSDDTTTTEDKSTGKVYTDVEMAQTQSQMRAARAEAKDNRLAKEAAETAKTAAEAALAAASTTHTDALSKADARFVRSELKAAAIAAGINDASDALAMIPMDKVERDADGNPTNADALLADLKATKPYLFAATPATTGNTSQPKAAPRAAPASTKRATEMTEEEYAILKASHTR